MEKKLYAQLGMIYRALNLHIEAICQLSDPEIAACLNDLSETLETLTRKHLEEIVAKKRLRKP